MQLDIAHEREEGSGDARTAVLVADASSRTSATAAVPDAQLLEWSARIENAREEERAMLARELHDDIGGTLAALKIVVARVQKRGADAALKAELGEMTALLDNASVATQRIIRALRPGILDQGLVVALEWEAKEFQRRTGIVCNFRSNRSLVDVPKGQGVTVYRVCQEALTNVAKHAAASVVEVQLHRDGDGITLEISDNGRGFDASQSAPTDSWGVRGMQERARSHGGWLQIDSTAGRGTTVMLSIPLRRAQDARP